MKERSRIIDILLILVIISASDNKVDWLEKNLFDDKFVNPSPPLILSLTWMPVRENLDKIYDINVTFIATEKDGLSEGLGLTMLLRAPKQLLPSSL